MTRDLKTAAQRLIDHIYGDHSSGSHMSDYWNRAADLRTALATDVAEELAASSAASHGEPVPWTVEEAISDRNGLIGWQMKLGAQAIQVWRNQAGMPGFRDGSGFLPRIGETISYRSSSAASQGAPVAWVDPGTRDVITEARKTAWQSEQFGTGMAARAAAYTQPLYAAPSASERQQPEMGWSDANDAATAEALRKLLRREPTLKEVTDVQKAVCQASERQQGGECKTCGGTGVVDDGELTHSEGGIEYSEPIKCIKDCPACGNPARTAPAPAATRAGADLRGIDVFEATEIPGFVKRGSLARETLLVQVADLPKVIERALSAQPLQAPPAAPSAEQGEVVAWVNPANVVSAAISRKRGGPFDQHTWSEQRTDYHSMPLFVTQPAMPVGWQPIETAPKDGTTIQLAVDGHSTVGGWVCDEDQGAEYEGQLGMAGWWSIDWPGTDGTRPTHWQPIAAAPKTGGANV